MEGAVVSERGEKQLQGLGLDQPGVGNVVDDEVREVRLPRDGAQGSEFRHGEASDVVRVDMRVGYPLELGCFGRVGCTGRLAKLGEMGKVCGHVEAPAGDRPSRSSRLRRRAITGIASSTIQLFPIS